MCRMRTRIGNRGVKVLRKYENRFLNIRAELTRKMTIDGKIIYAVVVTNTRTGERNYLETFHGILGAWNTYKMALGHIG